MANEYLTRTPTSTGNREVFTISVWYKKSLDNTIVNNGQQTLLRSGDTLLRFDTNSNEDDKIRFYAENASNTNILNLITSSLYRDNANWTHILANFNSTQSTDVDRASIYVNGVKLTEFSTSTRPSINELPELFIPLTAVNLGLGVSGEYFKGQLCDYFVIDGQALTPDVFGFYKEGKGYQSSGTEQRTDFRPGQWVPKAPRIIKSEINRRGGFGVNGFYLPMNDSSNFGADFHCTPNSIIKLKGEDLPQPRNGLPTTSDDYVSQLREDPYAANLILAVPGVNTQPTGSELVTNGTFDTDVSGWTITDTGTIVRQSDGTVEVTRGTSAEVVYQDITTVVGTTYELSVDITNIAGSHGQVYVKSTPHSGSLDTNIGYSFYTGTYKGTFTADTTTTRIILYAHTSGSSSYDNISVKETTIRDYSADIRGSGTNKTLTPYADASVRNPHQRNGRHVNGYYGSAMSVDGTGDCLVVDQSADFNLGDGDYTIEGWYYDQETARNTGTHCFWAIGGVNTDGTFALFYENTDLMLRGKDVGQAYENIIYVTNHNTPVKQWNHLCVERVSGRTTLYLNGVALQTTTDTTTIAQGNFTIGAFDNGGGYPYYGYIQDIRVYKGVAKYKGGFDVPKPYAPENSSTNYGIETWRQVSDNCKNNFCTMDPLHSYTVKRNTGAYVATILNFTEGNLNVRNSGNGGLSPQMAGFSSFGMDSGKWYWELSNWENPTNERYGISLGREQVFVQNGNGAAIECMLQVSGSTGEIASGGNHNGTDYEYLVSGTIDNTNATGLTSSSDVVGLAFDRDNMAFYVYTNGTLTASITNITTSKTKVSTWFATKGNYSSSSSSGQTYNFGQNPTFGGTLLAGTYTDSNGKGLFKYQPPAGYLALCEDNLPTPAIADPGEYFKTVLWTGVNDTVKIKCGFQPDFVWIKNRDYVNWHALYDSIRGPYLELNSNEPSANRDRSSNDGLRSFDPDGFTSGLDDNTGGRPGDSYVAYCWKAGGAAVSNTDGTITSQVSANQDAGFSIVKWTSNGATSVVTTGHGLAKTPKFMLLKRTVAADNWFVYHESIQTNNNQYLQLNTASATITSPNDFWSTSSSTFGIRQSSIATNGQDCIAYCWAEIPGYSRFSTYQGTGQSEGPFVWCGFKPAWVMVKNADDTGGRSWGIQDSSRSSTNPCNKHLKADEPEVENSGLAASTFQIDMLSNGFKVRNNTGIWNNSGETIIFAAFAESPFQTASAK